jgi:DNA-binding NarL/FixJ family response regulator
MKALVDRQPPRVVIALQLSDGVGAALLRYIQASGLTTKVAIYTAATGGELLDAAVQLGPDRIISKQPSSLPQLLRWAWEGRGARRKAS